MKNQNLFSEFTNLYSLSKTLRFELIPQGKTTETFDKWIKELEEKEAKELLKTNLLAQDEHRAESYKKVKKILDEFYRNYQLPKKEKHFKDAFEKCQDNLRKEIVEAFKQEKYVFR